MFQDVEGGGAAAGHPPVVVVARHGHRHLHLTRTTGVLSHQTPGDYLASKDAINVRVACFEK